MATPNGASVALMPFFTFYGGKYRAAKHYPAPTHDVIVEPFAGSAGYSINHYGREVRLFDLDPVIVETWRYLLSSTPEDIAALPDLEPGQTTDDLDLPLGARYLIGWWLNKGSAQPKKRPSTFMLKHAAGAPYWGESIRERIARQLPLISHWTVTQASYADVPNVEATWFIDPPYQKAGRHYRCGSRAIDFAELAEWSKARRGQRIVCEADDADWLPFRPLVSIDGTEGRQKAARARMEVIWTGETGCESCAGAAYVEVTFADDRLSQDLCDVCAERLLRGDPLVADAQILWEAS